MSANPMFEKLRRHIDAQSLPEKISYHDRGHNFIVKLLLESSVDEVELAIKELNDNIMATTGCRNGLANLTSVARKQGAVGTDQISQIAEEVTK